MTVKLTLFLPAGRHGFEFYEVIKSTHSRSYVNLFIMSKNEKEQNLGRYHITSRRKNGRSQARI